jgi:hypothetical protein
MVFETESYIEKVIGDYARSKSCINFKFSSPSRKGVPDRIFMFNGRVMFIEFKRRGKKTTPLQNYTIGTIRAQGIVVNVIDNVLDGKECIDEFVN